MRVIFAIGLLTAVVLSSPCYAEKTDTGARALVEGGVTAYVKSGAGEAMKFWIKGSALEGNPQALTQANNLRQIEDFYGKPIGYDIIKEYEAGPKVRVIYFTINYEKGAAFGVFQAYKNRSGAWINTQFKFHTDAAQILPPCLLAP